MLSIQIVSEGHRWHRVRLVDGFGRELKWERHATAAQARTAAEAWKASLGMLRTA